MGGWECRRGCGRSFRGGVGVRGRWCDRRGEGGVGRSIGRTIGGYFGGKTGRCGGCEGGDGRSIGWDFGGCK